MRNSHFLLLLVGLMVSFIAHDASAQGSRNTGTTQRRGPAAVKSNEIGSTAVVIDETLSVLRLKPSLYADSLQRMRRGREVKILAVKAADGVNFYRISAPPNHVGWVQADAVFGRFRPSDEARLANLVQAAEGFERLELASAFLEVYPKSQFSPAILLLFGDLAEEAAVKLSKDASIRLKRQEMAASAAPSHSYFLNFVGLDRYRKLGIRFLFNSATKTFHYSGESWAAIVKLHTDSLQAAEAQKRLLSLKQRMEVR
ncbi:MAG: SH3 domain-containing protein [Pyrinomonadaceae bacterium]